MTIQEAIGKAIDNGWRADIVEKVGKERFLEVSLKNFEMPLMSRTFWQSLGKAMGWKEETRFCKSGDGCEFNGKRMHERDCVWEYMFDFRNAESTEKWKNLIDHLAEGKDIESFFKEL